MKTIKTSFGVDILVDEKDYEELSKYCWTFDRSTGYAVRVVKVDGRYERIYLHRVILGLSFRDGRFGDHRNGVKTDNRRDNLRISTRAQNNQNMRSHLGISGLKGVHKSKKNWAASIGYKGRKVHLGVFTTKELASEFREMAADMLHGDFACHETTPYNPAHI